MAKFHCIHCGQRIEAPDHLAETNSNCPNCKSAITIPPLNLTVPSTPPLVPSSSAASTYSTQETINSTHDEPSSRKRKGLGRLAFLGVFLGLCFVASFAVTVTGEGIAGYLVTLPFLLIAASSRMDNVGKSQLWILLGLVPMVSLGFYIYCCVAAPAQQK